MIDFETDRINRGMSQRDFAQQIGISEETIRRIENGAKPSPRIGKKIADFYGVKVTELWPVAERNAA